MNDTPVTAWIGLGANLGDAVGTLHAALDALRATRGITNVTVAPFYASAPVDAQGPTFVNTVARLRTTLDPIALLDRLQAIELEHGRERPYRNAPRTLDLDIVAIDGLTMESERLTLPHPRAHQRAFVLRPLADLDPDFVFTGQAAMPELLAACADQQINRLTE